LEGDRLSRNKVLGLILAFVGVSALFVRGNLGDHSLRGDLLGLLSGVLWGMTTVYVKRFMAKKVGAMNVLFYQLFFSAPFLFVLSFLFERGFVFGFSMLTFYSLLYQCIIVAFLSYLVWFELVDRYPVSLLHAFSFFTPIFGVMISGILMLKEPIHGRLIFALIMVTSGTIIANRLDQK
jgi:drug/metabolite transporter (DMT)-like permease